MNKDLVNADSSKKYYDSNIIKKDTLKKKYAFMTKEQSN